MQRRLFSSTSKTSFDVFSKGWFDARRIAALFLLLQIASSSVQASFAVYQPLKSVSYSSTSLLHSSLAHSARNNKRRSKPAQQFSRGNYESNSKAIQKRKNGYQSDYEYDDDDDFFNAPMTAPTASTGGRNQQQHHESSNLEGRESDLSTPSGFFSKKTLRDPSFRASDNSSDSMLNQLCQDAGITRPSRIQALAWPLLLSGQHAIVADQTGSGKTLAYLVPLLQRIDTQTMPRRSSTGVATPRILILAPTAELADQIHAVCIRLTQNTSLKTMVITATGKLTTSIRDQIRRLQRHREPLDILISTPGRLSTILRTRNAGLDLSHLQALVLDEVDILMMDETFGPQLKTIGDATAAMSAPTESPITQFVFVTATLPDAVVERVQSEFPDVVQVRGPGLHRVALTVDERLVDVSVPSQYNRDAKLCFDVKAKQLLKALRQTRCRRTLIFCNTVESCRQVENLLHRHDRKGRIYQVLAYHNAMTPEARNANLAMFAHGDERSEEARDHILVCTDRAARGVDFDAAPVDHVVLFDFPKDPAEYVRRVGRTARAGRKGTTTVFAYGWQLPLARKVMGKKLESFTVAADEMEDMEEYRGGAKARKEQRRMRMEKDQMIKGNIEGSRLWDERS